MLTPDALQWLRCPIDPARNAGLLNEETHLTCVNCRVRFRVRDGIPDLVPDDAELPEGCSSRRELLCQSGGGS